MWFRFQINWLLISLILNRWLIFKIIFSFLLFQFLNYSFTRFTWCLLCSFIWILALVHNTWSRVFTHWQSALVLLISSNLLLIFKVQFGLSYLDWFHFWFCRLLLFFIPFAIVCKLSLNFGWPVSTGHTLPLSLLLILHNALNPHFRRRCLLVA